MILTQVRPNSLNPRKLKAKKRKIVKKTSKDFFRIYEKNIFSKKISVLLSKFFSEFLNSIKNHVLIYAFDFEQFWTML